MAEYWISNEKRRTKLLTDQISVVMKFQLIIFHTLFFTCVFKIIVKSSMLQDISKSFVSHVYQFWLINVSKFRIFSSENHNPYSYKKTDLVEVWSEKKRQKKDPLCRRHDALRCVECAVFNGQCMVIQLNQILHTIIMNIFYCKLLTQIRIHNYTRVWPMIFLTSKLKPLL